MDLATGDLAVAGAMFERIPGSQDLALKYRRDSIRKQRDWPTRRYCVSDLLDMKRGTFLALQTMKPLHLSSCRACSYPPAPSDGQRGGQDVNDPGCGWFWLPGGGKLSLSADGLTVSFDPDL